MSEIVDWHIETERTLVRPAVVDDAEALHASRGQMPFDPQKRTLAQTRRLLAAMDRRPVRDASGRQQFAVIERTSGGFLGDIGVNFDTPRNQQAEIGFAFAPAARGQGYATEAVGALVEHLFALGRHRLMALTDMRNVPTHRLLERLRFRREGVYLKSWAEAGDWFDEVGYARLGSE